MLPRMARGRPWTNAEDRELRQAAKSNRNYGILAHETKRTDPRPFPAEKYESPQTRVGGNGRRSMAREPQNTPCSRPLLRPSRLRTPSPRADCSSRVRREDVDGLDAAVQAGPQGP